MVVMSHLPPLYKEDYVHNARSPLYTTEGDETPTFARCICSIFPRDAAIPDVGGGERPHARSGHLTNLNALNLEPSSSATNVKAKSRAKPK